MGVVDVAIGAEAGWVELGMGYGLQWTVGIWVGSASAKPEWGRWVIGSSVKREKGGGVVTEARSMSSMSRSATGWGSRES
jgi:hypothetical protein